MTMSSSGGSGGTSGTTGGTTGDGSSTWTNTWSGAVLPCGDLWASQHLATQAIDPFDPEEHIVWVDIPPGEFIMGSPLDEIGREPVGETQHQVTLTRGFRLMDAEVTRMLYAEVMPGIGALNTTPYIRATWHDAAAVTNVFSCMVDLPACYECELTADGPSCTDSAEYPTIYDCPGYRLPTDAEWEYAYRAGTTTAYYNGPNTTPGYDDERDPNLDPIACYSVGTPCGVRSKDPNDWGLYDMAGNINEWTSDWWQEDLGTAAVADPTGGVEEELWPSRTSRNGHYDSIAKHCRAARREPFLLYFDAGIRVARTDQP